MIEEPHLANQFEDQLEGKYQEVMRNSAPARHGYDTAEQFQLDEECRLKAAIVQLAELNKRAMAIISNAIMHGMPITKEVADVRNQIVCSNETTGEDPMNKSSELAAGQWWLHSSGKAMFVAFDERSIGEESNIPLLTYTSKGNYNWLRPGEFVRRLPDDAGFDWKPEPEIVYPRWAVPTAVTMTLRATDNNEIAYYKFESAGSGETFCIDGTSFKWKVFDLDSDEYQYTTQAEAEERIVRRKSAEPDPEEWVEFDTRSVDFPRYEIDELKHATETEFEPVIQAWHNKTEAWSQTQIAYKIRCRRKDLPQLPESKPNRIPVRLYWYDGNVVARFAHSPPTDPSFVEIKLDPQMIISGSGFYVEGPVSP